MIPAVGDTQTRVLLFVVAYHSRYQRGPYITEIMDALELESRSTVWNHLRALQAKGLVAWEPFQHGTLHPLVRFVWDDKPLLEVIA